jgi:Raf kinase inhibitor-like YbhB/YbcL family protein
MERPTSLSGLVLTLGPASLRTRFVFALLDRLSGIETSALFAEQRLSKDVAERQSRIGPKPIKSQRFPSATPRSRLAPIDVRRRSENVCRVLSTFTLGFLMALTLSSPNFKNGGEVPRANTCEGGDTSPALAWSDVPKGARTLVLIVDDPDAPDPAAPRMTWVHWVLYNLPASATKLSEGVDPGALPHGARVGVNDFGRNSYGGPCPPVGRHRYFFKLYALDTELPDLGTRATKAAVEKAMKGHVVGEAQLMGTYKKD